MEYFDELDKNLNDSIGSDDLKNTIDSYPCSLYNKLLNTSKYYFYNLFTQWMKDLEESGFWDESKGSINGHKIRYNLANKAFDAGTKTFSSRGLYVWGVGEKPRYVGKTDKTLRKRFKSRYLWGDGVPKQCELFRLILNKYTNKDVKKKYDIFRDKSKNKEIIDDELSTLKNDLEITSVNSFSRLVGALDFATYADKEDDLWFAVLPIEEKNKDYLDVMETFMILAANEYNYENGYPYLLNRDKVVK
ncbi:hypothetical protein Metev_0160 [Methanohalobium evestigatum Z-7303]|uniref:Uncharacterized protein n=1 Tax=Methanohalobium evestigatum (strain ATCC BAA-1072 / DSM 3721 / NBRC 107634 / OCM 161 / Z-7303) TaxID=644295 RepID=D7E669_METEZ|nr:hypothetical protein [Methanohalobium evestigatum]ADI73091.1 hypothetical protein Metev_0160 [Methanohalobium evestigatum Z-7303]